MSGTYLQRSTAWKVSKYGVFSGSYFPVFSPNMGKYGPEKTPHLDIFHAVESSGKKHASVVMFLAFFTVLKF